MQPFLKWAGGKRNLAPRLKELYQPYATTHTWFEPFCGGLGATLGVMPSKALLCDVNRHLINLYRQIDQGMVNEISWANDRETFLQVRQDFNAYPFSDALNAERFYYLNRTCFNGLCRFNSQGQFNTPFGSYKNPKLDHDFAQYKQVFKDWDFFNLGYAESLANIDKPYFIYADPPYDDGFVNYSGGFTWDDQVNLATLLADSNQPVVASNKASDRIIDLYYSKGFMIDIIPMPRRISANGNREPVDEMLATRF